MTNHDAWCAFDPNATDPSGECTCNLSGPTENLRRWKEEAMVVLSEWDAVHAELGSPGRLGESRATASLRAVSGMRAEMAAQARLIDGLKAEITIHERLYESKVGEANALRDGMELARAEAAMLRAEIDMIEATAEVEAAERQVTVIDLPPLLTTAPFDRLLASISGLTADSAEARSIKSGIVTMIRRERAYVAPEDEL